MTTHTEKFDVRNRWTNAVQCTAEITCDANALPSVKLGLAVEWGVKARANLAGANLTGANLTDAYLTDANLAGANLAGANLTDANLAGANLAGANLTDANLAGAYLAGAYLAGAYLAGAYLAGADLAGANLADAYLAGANLTDAYLTDAYLAGAKWRDGIVIQHQPIQISGLSPYTVTILDQHMQIGCELHSLADWDAFDDRRILQMDGRTAAKFWDAHKAGLMAIARGNGRSFEPVTATTDGDAA